jgi:hypothetical protein
MQPYWVVKVRQHFDWWQVVHLGTKTNIKDTHLIQEVDYAE